MYKKNVLDDEFDDLSTILEDSIELPFELDNEDEEEIRVDVFFEAVDTVEFYIDDDASSSSSDDDEIQLQDSGKWSRHLRPTFQT